MFFNVPKKNLIARFFFTWRKKISTSYMYHNLWTLQNTIYQDFSGNYFHPHIFLQTRLPGSCTLYIMYIFKHPLDTLFVKISTFIFFHQWLSIFVLFGSPNPMIWHPSLKDFWKLKPLNLQYNIAWSIHTVYSVQG